MAWHAATHIGSCSFKPESRASICQQRMGAKKQVGRLSRRTLKGVIRSDPERKEERMLPRMTYKTNDTPVFGVSGLS